jgi:hypothetical protein
VRSIELRDSVRGVRTTSRARFVAWRGDVVGGLALEVRRLHTLEAGADAVFGYLEGNSP